MCTSSRKRCCNSCKGATLFFNFWNYEGNSDELLASNPNIPQIRENGKRNTSARNILKNKQRVHNDYGYVDSLPSDIFARLIEFLRCFLEKDLMTRSFLRNGEWEHSCRFWGQDSDSFSLVWRGPVPLEWKLNWRGSSGTWLSAFPTVSRGGWLSGALVGDAYWRKGW